MKKRIIALACGTCFLLGLTSGCPCYSGYSTTSAKTDSRVVSAQPAVEPVVVAASNAVGI